MALCVCIGATACAASGAQPVSAHYQGYSIGSDYIRHETFVLSVSGQDLGGHAPVDGITFCPASSGWFCVVESGGVAFPLRAVSPGECWTFMESTFVVQSVAFDTSQTFPVAPVLSSGKAIDAFVIRQRGSTPDERVYFYTVKDGIIGFVEFLHYGSDSTERFDYWHAKGPALGGADFRSAISPSAYVSRSKLTALTPRACDMPANQPLHLTTQAAEPPSSRVSAGVRRL